MIKFDVMKGNNRSTLNWKLKSLLKDQTNHDRISKTPDQQQSPLLNTFSYDCLRREGVMSNSSVPCYRSFTKNCRSLQTKTTLLKNLVLMNINNSKIKNKNKVNIYNKEFNRTKTDQNHNFIGKKYNLQVKTEKKEIESASPTKYNNFRRKRQCLNWASSEQIKYRVKNQLEEVKKQILHERKFDQMRLKIGKKFKSKYEVQINNNKKNNKKTRSQDPLMLQEKELKKEDKKIHEITPWDQISEGWMHRI